MENIDMLDKKVIKQKIISDSQYKSWMKKIQSITNEFAISSEFNSTVALDHGIEHMDRVANNVYKLLKECNFDEKTCKLGYIAGLIHDIGMVDGKTGHAQKGAEMAKIFLEELNLVDACDIKVITDAIENHGSGGNSIEPITLSLAICDKADMCRKRSLGKLSPIQFIESYTMDIHRNILQINYVMDELKGKEGLYIIPKSIDIPKILGTKLGMQVEFYINGKYEEFEDRIEYKGQIYQRKIN